MLWRRVWCIGLQRCRGRGQAALRFSGVAVAASSTSTPTSTTTPVICIPVNKTASRTFGQDLVSLLKDLVFCLRVALRALQLALICSPLIAASPILLYFCGDRGKRLWYRGLTRTVQMCGPVCVKLGQWASTRRDIFPKELCDELSRLQRRAKAHSWTYTKKVLAENFDADIFSGIEQEPVGSGCCAQVYKATLAKSEEVKTVAVKVLHPGIREKFQRDLLVVETFGRVLGFFAPALAEWLNVEASIAEFTYLMRGQLDLEIEAKNMDVFRTNFSSDSSVVFPRPIWPLCRKEVLVETFEDGVHVSDYIRKGGAQINQLVANVGIKMLLKMIFVDNFVHGDLHPGNILVRERETDVQLVILDHGIVTSLSERDMANFSSVFSAVIRGDGRKVGHLFLEHSPHECVDESAFVEKMAAIVTEVRQCQLSLERVEVSALLNRVFGTLLEHRVRLEANYASVILAIMVLEGLGRSLHPKLDIMRAALPFVLKT